MPFFFLAVIMIPFLYLNPIFTTEQEALVSYNIELTDTSSWAGIQKTLKTPDNKPPITTKNALDTLFDVYGFDNFYMKRVDSGIVASSFHIGSDISYYTESIYYGCKYELNLSEERELTLQFHENVVNLGLCDFDVIKNEVASHLLTLINDLEFGPEKMAVLILNRNKFTNKSH